VTNSAKKILVGFSGGADSTAAVLLLRDQGWDVTGLHLRVTNEGGSVDPSVTEVAEYLGLPLILADVSECFQAVVIHDFCKAYSGGETPNPCVLCNPAVKFQTLCSEADRFDIPYIATGHYARIYRNSDGLFYLRMGANQRKDQSYMLYRLSQDVLARTIFPLGEIDSKEEIRRFLEDRGVPNARKQDSQDICFIRGKTYQDFLQERGVLPKPGPFLDMKGHVVGTHHGIHNYTPGQRKGLGIALGKPAYVVSVQSGTNAVILGSEEDLLRQRVEIRNAFFTACGNTTELPEAYQKLKVTVKLRYTARFASATLRQDPGENITVDFDLPQRAPAPGQSAVFYLDDLVLGGGTILE